MSWVSEDLEGSDLNRRLGTYNCTWSGATILGPLLAGLLVETSTALPIIFTAIGLMFCFLFVSLATNGSVQTTLFGNAATSSVAGCEPLRQAQGRDSAVLLRFRWIARIALFSACVSSGILRSQFALLFTGLGFSEVWFGILVTVFGVFNFAVLTAAGKCNFWHFKTALLLAAQALLSISLVLTIYGRSFSIFFLAFVIMGCGFGFAYSSHLYYGTCGAKRRSVQMVIHEATISAGIIVGSGIGGYLAKNVGLYQPYQFALALVSIGLFIQLTLLLYNKLKLKMDNRPKYPR
jgi:MFS family permease